ncbi:MAG: hypothetical protein C4521_02390 [Actinobacteria bacterium]|nr:MAG: hypothetical protein C4521_02390 [Actinomycetota bacterium]
MGAGVFVIGFGTLLGVLPGLAGPGLLTKTGKTAVIHDLSAMHVPEDVLGSLPVVEATPTPSQVAGPGQGSGATVEEPSGGGGTSPTPEGPLLP